MNYIILPLLLSVLTSCALKPSVKSELKYEKIQSFEIGVSSENDVARIFGEPTSRSEKNGYYTLNYNDPTSGYQRVSLSFLSVNKKLSGLVWIPFYGEIEASLDGAKAHFQKAKFKTVVQAGDNPHSISETTSLVDEKSGVTILLASNKIAVEAIAMFDVNSRLPAATTTKKSDRPYTFGDE